jgi:hypothetical protein
MLKVRDDHKAALMESGKWPDFVLFCDELKAQGVKPCEANRQAVEQFLGPDVFRKEKKADSPKETPSSLPTSNIPDVVKSALLSDFEGREASEVEIIRWVARYMDIADVTPEMCPDPAAWSLLNACRRNPVFAVEFWRSVYTKIIPSRSQLEGKMGDGLMDGKVQVEIIDKILVLKQKAESGSEKEESK